MHKAMVQLNSRILLLRNSSKSAVTTDEVNPYHTFWKTFLSRSQHPRRGAVHRIRTAHSPSQRGRPHQFSPWSQRIFQSYASILPTSRSYIAQSARGVLALEAGCGSLVRLGMMLPQKPVFP